MADANVSRIGAINQGTDTDALFLKVFAGEVLASFERANIMLPLTQVRTITSGKSAQFPVIGRIGAEYHVPGTEIKGLNVNHAERVITIDDLLISHAFIADIDEAKNHYDVRSQYTTEMGRKLAKCMDENILKELVKAARSGPNVADEGYPGGVQISNDKFRLAEGGAADTKEWAAALAEGIIQAAQILDEHDVPEEDRYAIFSPREYYALLHHTDLINKMFGGAGSISDGRILRIAGIEIKKSNNVPHTDTSESDTRHGVDASKTVGLVWHKAAVGTVKLLDLSLQSEWDIRRQGTLMVARYAVGHGVLRPECAVELKTASLNYN